MPPPKRKRGTDHKPESPDIIRNVHRESVIKLTLDSCDLRAYVSDGLIDRFELELKSPDEDTHRVSFNLKLFQEFADVVIHIQKLAEEEAANQYDQ